MANVLHLNGTRLNVRQVCPPGDPPPCPKPYQPPKGSGSSGGGGGGSPAKVASALIYPVNLSRVSATGTTEYTISSKLSFPYIIRGIQPVSSGFGGPSTNVVFGAVRATYADTAVAASFNAGVNILNPFGNSEDFALGSGGSVDPIWLPVDVGPHRLILRTTNTGTGSPAVGFVILITPLAEVTAAFEDPGPGPNPNPGGQPFESMQHTECTPIQNPDGTWRLDCHLVPGPIPNY